MANEHHPFTYREGTPGLFFIEGVSAAGEVKSVLTSEQLESSFAAARHYKTLEAIVPSGAVFVTSQSIAQRFYVHPPYFLFAFESQLTFETIALKVIEQTRDVYRPGESIDGIFVLDRGFFVDLGEGKDGFGIRDPATKQYHKGWKGMPDTNVLFVFLAWLSISLPSFSGGTPILGHYLMGNADKPS